MIDSPSIVRYYYLCHSLAVLSYDNLMTKSLRACCFFPVDQRPFWWFERWNG